MKLFTRTSKTIESFSVNGATFTARADETYTRNGAVVSSAVYFAAARTAQWEGQTINQH